MPIPYGPILALGCPPASYCAQHEGQKRAARACRCAVLNGRFEKCGREDRPTALGRVGKNFERSDSTDGPEMDVPSGRFLGSKA